MQAAISPDPVTRSDGANRNGKAATKPATLSAIAKSFFAKLTLAEADAIGEIEEIERRQQREMVLLAQSAATEAVKCVNAVMQSLQKQVAEFKQQQAGVQQALTQVCQLFNGELRAKSEEIRRLQSDQVDREVRLPALRRLCKRAKDAFKGQLELRRQHNPSKARDTGIATLERIAMDTVQDLSDLSITPFSVEPGGKFDPQTCDLIRREKRPTADPKLDGHVAEQESPGFRRGDDIIEKATVFVFEYEPSQKERIHDSE